MIYGAFSLTAGEDISVTIRLRPQQSVAGWTVGFRAWSRTVNFSFPPSTIQPLDLTVMPVIPMWTGLIPNLAVIPGIQPALPATGGTEEVEKTSSSSPGGITVSDVDLGVFVLTLAREQTLVLPPDLYWWQFSRIDAGHQKKYAEGSFLVMAGS